MPRNRRSRLFAIVIALAVAACVAPFAYASFVTSTASQSATYSSGSLGTPAGTALAWGTCVAGVSFQMNVTWTAATNAKSYQIFRGTATGGPYTQIGTAGGTSYTDSGPQVGPPAFTWNTTYFYVVKAVAGGWVSGNSVEASMRTPKSANCK